MWRLIPCQKYKSDSSQYMQCKWNEIIILNLFINLWVTFVVQVTKQSGYFTEKIMIFQKG